MAQQHPKNGVAPCIRKDRPPTKQLRLSLFFRSHHMSDWKADYFLLGIQPNPIQCSKMYFSVCHIFMHSLSYIVWNLEPSSQMARRQMESHFKGCCAIYMRVFTLPHSEKKIAKFPRMPNTRYVLSLGVKVDGATPPGKFGPSRFSSE